MKNITIFVDDKSLIDQNIDLYQADKYCQYSKLPFLGKYLIDQIIENNRTYDFSKNFNFVKNNKYFSFNIKYFDKYNCHDNNIIIILTQYNFETYDFLKLYNNVNNALVISTYNNPPLSKYSDKLSLLLTKDDINVYLSSLKLCVKNNDNEEINIIREFENRRFPLEKWTLKIQLFIINYSLQKYGYENTIREDSWLMYNWRNYIFQNLNLNTNAYWHYTMIVFWATLLYKKIKVVNFENVWEKYYSPEVIYSPDARDHYVCPNLLKL